MERTTMTRVTGAVALVALAAACSGSNAQDANDEPATATVPTGTTITAELNEELSTRSHGEGDAFAARVVSAGHTAVPSGAVIHGVVTGAQKAGDGKKGVLKLDFRTIEVRGEARDFRARVLEANPEKRSSSSTGEDAAKVGGAAAAGAVLGRVIGGDGTGAAVGAAIGAAAGTGVVLATKDGFAVLPRGSEIRLELTEPVTVPRPSGAASGEGA